MMATTNPVQNLRIIFMGTPEFAVPMLDILTLHGYHVVAVVTAPDKPAGRGLKVHESAVKQYAVAHGLPVLQPVRLKDPDFLDKLHSFHPDLQVVVAFRMLPEVVWNLPGKGTINLHASLLPQYRGAAPINHVILNGEKETGLTTFKLQHEIDTGQIIYQQKVPIGKDETAGELHDKLMESGAGLLLKTVQAIAADDYPLLPQSGLADPQHPLKEAPKIFREDGRINWHSPIDQVYNHIRGLSPYPAAWTMLNGKMLKIYDCRKSENDIATGPGLVETDHKSYLRIGCQDGAIDIRILQLEGKKRITVEEFLRGYRDGEFTVS